eukprot:433340_1
MASLTDDESNNDNINEYNTDSDSDDWGEDEQKTKILSKKQKQTLAFQTLIRTAKTHFNNSEYLNFQQDLKLINNSIMTNKWSKKDYQMPKFFAKHMFEIFNKICDLNPENEQNQKEQTALKKLKKNFKKDLRHFKQLDVYNKNPSIGKWSNESSDLGEEENQQDIEESDDDALFQIADTAGGNEEENEESNEESNEEQNEEENEENDSEDSNEGSDSYWSSWEDNKVDVKEAESEESDVDEPGGDGKKDEDEDKNKKKTFGIEAFDEETLAKMRHRSFWVKKDKRVKKKESEKDRKRREKAAAQRIKKKEEAKKKEDEAKHTAENGDIKPVKVERKKKKHGPTKWSVNRINQTFAHVLTDRGKTNVNRDQIVNHLEELMEQCELHNAEQARLTVISVLISFYFDTASRKTTGMSGSRWRKTRGLISTMLKSLSKNINTFRVSNDADIRLILKETDDENKKEKDENSNLEWMKALEGGDTNDNNKTDLLKKKKDTISTGFSVIEMLSKKKKIRSKISMDPW